MHKTAVALFLTLTLTAHAVGTIGGGAIPSAKSSSTFSTSTVGSPAFGVRNDADATLISRNLGLGPLSVDASGKLKVTGTFAVAEQATSGAGGVTNGSSLFKMAAGRDLNSVVRVLRLTPSDRLVVDGSEVTQPISAAALPLPSGAATEVTLADFQGDNHVDLTLLHTDFGVVEGKQDSGNTSLVTISNKLDVAASTRASETTLSAVSAKLPATLGQKTMTNSLAVAIASDQSAVGITNPSRVISASNTFTNPALAAFDLQEGVAEDVTAYQSASVSISSDREMLVDIYQYDALGQQVSDEAYDVPALTPFSIPVKLNAKTFKVGVNNFTASAANFTLTTYLNPTGDAFPSGVVDTSTIAGSFYSRLRTQSDQLPSSLGQKVSASSASVVIASDQSAIATAQPAVASASLSNGSNGASSATLVSSNSSRKGLYLFNDSTTDCYYKFGTTASTSSFTVKLFSYDTYTMDSPIYTGRIDWICTAATGSTRVTEL